MAPDEQRLDLLIDLRRYKEAEEYARECLAGNPDWAQGHTQLARVLMALRRKSEALEAAKAGVAKNVQSAFAHAILAYVYLELAYPRQAMDSVLEALRLLPTYSWAHYLRTRIYERANNYRKMRQAAMDGLRECPTYESLIAQKGWAELYLGRRDEALATAENGLRLHPNAAGLLNLRDYTLKEIGRERLFFKSHHFRKAEESLREAVRIDPAENAYRNNREANLTLWRARWLKLPLSLLGVVWMVIAAGLTPPARASVPGDNLMLNAFIVSFVLVLAWYVLMFLDDSRKLAYGVVPLEWLGIPRPAFTPRQRRWGLRHWLIGGFLMAASILIASIRHFL